MDSKYKLDLDAFEDDLNEKPFLLKEDEKDFEDIDEIEDEFTNEDDFEN